MKFHTKDCEKTRKTQNSGVSVIADTLSFTRDGVPFLDSIVYYGLLKDVVELYYRDGNRTVLFKCDWWDVTNRQGIKKDEYGYTSVNFSRTLHTNEPFILASQA